LADIDNQLEQKYKQEKVEDEEDDGRGDAGLEDMAEDEAIISKTTNINNKNSN
jgi:hypothetical protein